MLYFEWDSSKAARNLQKHGITFEAATAVLEDPFAIEQEYQVIEGRSNCAYHLCKEGHPGRKEGL